MTPSLKPLLLALAVVVMMVTAGCNNLRPTASKEAMGNQVVSCSHFYKITDDYQTPEGRYLLLDKYSNKPMKAETLGLDLPYNLKGKYAACDLVLGCELWNLTQLSENETGMRDACRVEPS